MLLHLEPSEEFLIKRAELTFELGEAARPVFEALGDAIDKLKDTGWGPELEIRKTAGNRFAYPFHEKYQVTFKIKGQRPADGPVQEMWLFILSIDPLPQKSGSVNPEENQP
jgi:hypothetical protein